MHQLQQLRSFDATTHTVDEMVFLFASASMMIAAYTDCDAEAPEWLVEVRDKLKKEIELRSRDTLEKELKELTAREDALKTADEKRRDLSDKRKRIEDKLKRTPAAAG